MAVTRWGFELGANGDTLGSTNASADSIVATGGTAVISTTQKFEGTRAALFTGTSTSGGVYLQKNLGTATTQLGMDAFIYLTALPSAETSFLWMGASGTRGCSVSITTTGALTIHDGTASGGAVLWTSTATLALNTWYRVSLFATQNASTGTIRATLYTGNTGTTTDDSTLLTGRNTGSSAYDNIRIGAKASTGTATITAYIDAYAFDPAATDVLPIAAQSFFNTFEGGTNNVDLSAANTSGNSGTALASIAKNTGTTLQFSTTQARGTMSMRISYALSAAGYGVWNWVSSLRSVMRFYVYYENNFDTTFMEFTTIRSSAANVAKIGLAGATHSLVVQNSANIAVASCPYPLQVNSWYRFEIGMTIGTTTTNGRIEFAYYDNDSINPIWSYDSGATVNTGTAAFATIRIGGSNGPATQTLNVYYDDLAVQELTSGYIGPSAPGTTYDQTQFMPFFH